MNEMQSWAHRLAYFWDKTKYNLTKKKLECFKFMFKVYFDQTLELECWHNLAFYQEQQMFPYFHWQILDQHNAT